MIRPATLSDVPRLVTMGQRFLASSRYADHLGENAEQFRVTAEALIQSPDGTIFVQEDGETVIGMIGVLLFMHPLSGRLVGSELFWWVEPESRGRGLALLRQAEAWARDHEASALQMIAPTRSVARLYERLGYVQIETHYQRGFA